ncbi:MAG: DUF6544 family protein [Melioribacteraceae bacterium]|nr:DUF6544 family protein [Melioribacteraceae bacterium]
MKKFLLTIIGILFLVFFFFFFGGKIFTEISIESTISSLRDSLNLNHKEIFSHEKLNDQSQLIQKYFSRVVGNRVEIPKFVKIKQKARFKTDVNSDWFPMEAEQYFTTEEPNFLWNSELETSKYFWMNVIDSYIRGKGNTLIKFNSSITIADSWGIELDKSGLFRYISEAVYFPTKLVPAENLIWNILDSNIAEIKFKDRDISVVAKIFFNSDYTIERIETFDKYRALDDGFQKSRYTVYFSQYKLVNNSFLVPTYMEVEWDLASGPFKYGKFNVLDIDYE